MPPGAQVSVNDKPACTSDCTTKLVPGSYRISAKLEGFDTAAGDLKILPGQPARLS
ncbi:MAG: PEGA domain-containing protein [Acidobacteriota bacterium]